MPGRRSDGAFFLGGAFFHRDPKDFRFVRFFLRRLGGRFFRRNLGWSFLLSLDLGGLFVRRFLLLLHNPYSRGDEFDVCAASRGCSSTYRLALAMILAAVFSPMP